MRRCVRARGRSPSRGVAAAALLACSVSSPATEVREALARAAPLELAAGDARVVLDRVTFADVAVSLDGPRALVVGVVEADGRVRDGAHEVRLAYLGREAFAMERCASRGWCPAGAPLPALAGVVDALVATARTAGRTPVAWQVRVERDRATVGQDGGGAPDGHPAREVLELTRAGEAWRVARR